MQSYHPMPVLSVQDCDSLVALCAAAPKREAGLVGGAVAPQIRRADLVWLDDLPHASWVMDRMVPAIAQANRDSFGYDLDQFAESPQVARYGAERQGHFGWHSDIGSGALAARRKLTVVVQLSDPADYSGGVLEVWPDSNPRAVARDRGMGVVFPSFVLHRVTPVTEGVRWSLTLWAHGPAFR